MRIGIITIHFGVNYGSALQAYALTRYLNQEGFDAEIINYIPKRYGVRNYLSTEGHSFNLIQKVLFVIAAFPFRFYNRYIFKRFLEKYVPLSSKYREYRQLETMPKYDVYITGSDQVWNSDYNKEHQKEYYLTFAEKDSIKISYAASFGKEKLDNSEIIEIKDYLSTFKAISVREISGLEILKSCKVKGINVLDPIFLLSKADWEKFSGRRIVNEKYVFIYALDGEFDRHIEYAKQIANELSCKTVMVNFNKKYSHPSLDYCLVYKDPKEFLSLFRYSEFVVTNSFHGISFSLNLNKQFVPISRKKYNSRLENILTLANLEERMVIDTFDVNKALEYIDYEKVNDSLHEHRLHSKKFLDIQIKELKK